MARVEPRTVHCRGGAAVVVHTALPEDAAAIRDLLRDVNATTEFIVTLPHERPPDDAAMAERLRRVEAHASHLALVAEAAGDIVGSLDFGIVGRLRMAHGGSSGMQVRSTWRGRGVGRALIETLLAWARAHPTVEKVALEVFATNASAIGLYRSLGFVEEGRAVREFRLAPGRYVDEVKVYIRVE